MDRNGGGGLATLGMFALVFIVAGLAVAAAISVRSIPEIRRYLKMKSM